MKRSILLILSILLFATACGNDDGKAEQAGEAIDNAMEEAKETIEDLDGDGPAEEAGEAVDDALESAKKKSQEAIEAAEEAMAEDNN